MAAMDLEELFIRIFGDSGPFSVGRYDDFREIFMSGFPRLPEAWEENVPDRLSIAIHIGAIPAIRFLDFYHEKDPDKKLELQRELEKELEDNKKEIDDADTSQTSSWDGWKMGLLGMAGLIPSFLTGIISDKRIQDAYDKYFNAENEAINKALNMSWATYLSNQNKLAPFVNAGAHASNAYLHALGFPNTFFTRPGGDIDFTKINFNNGSINFGDDDLPSDLFEEDFWGNGVYKNIGEGDDIPQKGMDALAIQYWGKDKDGHGGVMGAVLGGDLTINQARQLSMVMWKDWIKDMVDSGVSKEDITKSVNDQKGFMHMMANLRKISGMDSDGGDIKNWINLTINGEAREFRNFNLEVLPIQAGNIDREYYDDKGQIVSYPFVDDFRITNGQQVLDAGDKDGNPSGITLNDSSIDPFIDWVKNTADIPQGFALRHLFGFEPTYKADSEGNITLIPSLESELIDGNWWAALPRSYKFPNDIFIRGYDQYLKVNRSPGYGVQWNYSSPYGLGRRFSSKPPWWDEDSMGSYDDIVGNYSSNNMSDNAKRNREQNANLIKYSNFINGVKGATAPPDWDLDKIWDEYDPGKKTEKSLGDALEAAEKKISGKDKEQLKSEYDQAVQNLASQGIVPEEFTSEFDPGSEEYLNELSTWATNLADETGYEGYDPDWEDKFTKDFSEEFDEDAEAHKRGLLRDMSMYPPGMGMGPDDTFVRHPVTGESRNEGLSRLLHIEAPNWKGDEWHSGGRWEINPSTMEIIREDGDPVGYFYPDETGWRLTRDAPTLTEEGRWIAPSNARMNEHQGIPRWILNGTPVSLTHNEPLLDGVDSYDFQPQYDPDEFLEKTGFTVNEWFSGVKDGEQIPQEELEAAALNLPKKKYGPKAEAVFEQYRNQMRDPALGDHRYLVNIAHLAALPESKYGPGPLAWPVEESRFLELGHQWRQVLQDEWDAKGRDEWINQRIAAEQSNNKGILENQKQRLDAERIRIQGLLDAAKSGRQEDIDEANAALELFNEERDEYQGKLNDFVGKEAARKTRIGVAQENINEYNTEWGDFLKQSQIDFKSSYYGNGDIGDGTEAGNNISNVNTNGVNGSNKLTDDEYFDGIGKVKLDTEDFSNFPIFDYDGNPIKPGSFVYGKKPYSVAPFGKDESPYKQRSGVIDSSGVPQAGANQASELLWGSGELAGGRGGIMGALLSGTIGFNEANRLASNIEKSWEKDMKDSGVTYEEMKGLKEELNPGFQFLRNNINNLQNFGGLELGGEYYEGFEIENGRVANGRDILQPQGFDLIEVDRTDPVKDWIKSAAGTPFDYKRKPYIPEPFDYKGKPPGVEDLGYGGKDLLRHPYDIPTGRDPLGREGSPYEQRSGVIDPSEVPQAGASQASELLWGGGELADGRGGIMGAVLAGTIDFNEASRIADNVEKAWEEDMRTSGISDEELAGLKEQLNPGFEFLRNNISNLEDFGGLELGGDYYDGFEVDADRGRVVNGRDILQPQGFDLITGEQADPITDWIKSAEGTIDDPYNVRMTPKYEYMLKHGGKIIQRQLQSIGQLRGTYGMNAYNQFIDKVLGDAEQETFERRKERETELFNRATKAEQSAYDRAFDHWKLGEAAKTEAEQEEYTRAMAQFIQQYNWKSEEEKEEYARALSQFKMGVGAEQEEYARAEKRWTSDWEAKFKLTQEKFKQKQSLLENLRNVMNIGATSAAAGAGQGSQYSNIISQLLQSQAKTAGTTELGKGFSGAQTVTGLGDLAGKGIKDLLKLLGLS